MTPSEEPVLSSPPEETSGELAATEVPRPPPLEDPPKPYPGFWQAVWLFVLSSLLQAAFIIPFAIVESFSPKLHLTKHPGLLAVAILGSGAIVIRMARRRLGISYGELAGPLPRPRVFVFVAIAVAGLLMFILPVIAWIVRRFPTSLPKIDLGVDQSLLGGFLLIVIAAPLVEETLFRGIFMRGFTARYGPSRAILISAALFGAAHLSPLRLVPTLLLGLFVGWLYVQTRSIWPGVLAHALNNSFALAAGFGAGRDSTDDLGHFTWGEPLFAVIGLMLLSYAIRALRANAEESGGAS